MASVTRSVVMGYNHNIRHGGRLFHVQTEDAGVPAAHLWTHIFHEGAAIASRNTEYRDLVGDPDLPSRVKKLMQRQHKAMLRELKGGVYDGVIEQLLGEIQRRATEVHAPAPTAGAGTPPTLEQPIGMVRPLTGDVTATHSGVLDAGSRAAAAAPTSTTTPPPTPPPTASPTSQAPLRRAPRPTTSAQGSYSRPPAAPAQPAGMHAAGRPRTDPQASGPHPPAAAPQSGPPAAAPHPAAPWVIAPQQPVKPVSLFATPSGSVPAARPSSGAATTPAAGDVPSTQYRMSRPVTAATPTGAPPRVVRPPRLAPAEGLQDVVPPEPQAEPLPASLRATRPHATTQVVVSRAVYVGGGAPHPKTGPAAAPAAPASVASRVTQPISALHRLAQPISGRRPAEKSVEEMMLEFLLEEPRAAR